MLKGLCFFKIIVVCFDQRVLHLNCIFVQFFKSVNTCAIMHMHLCVFDL